MGLLLVSTVAYSASAVAAYPAAVHLPISVMLLAAALGFAIGTLLQIRYFRMTIREGYKEKRWHISLIGGALLAVTLSLIYLVYKQLPLSNAYPLFVASIIVFLAIDLLLNRRMLTTTEKVLLAIGVLIVVLGTIMAGGLRFSLSATILPYIVAIIIAGGVSYYALLYDVKDYHPGTKLSFVGAGLVAFGLLSALFSVGSVIDTIYLPLAVLAGFFFSIAIGTEMQVMKLVETTSKKANVISRNFVNNFTYLDLVIVLGASVAIGSYTLLGLAGGALVLIGVIVLGIIK